MLLSRRGYWAARRRPHHGVGNATTFACLRAGPWRRASCRRGGRGSLHDGQRQPQDRAGNAIWSHLCGAARHACSGVHLPAKLVPGACERRCRLDVLELHRARGRLPSTAASAASHLPAAAAMGRSSPAAVGRSSPAAMGRSPASAMGRSAARPSSAMVVAGWTGRTTSGRSTSGRSAAWRTAAVVAG